MSGRGRWGGGAWVVMVGDGWGQFPFSEYQEKSDYGDPKFAVSEIGAKCSLKTETDFY